mmetsp:Transcript_29150/g.47142  ORF Transcript_29150/g.47142 Transcript_29150/m.47142 type:complete len:408 (-) Transcript_29150:1098-2321(-)
MVNQLLRLPTPGAQALLQWAEEELEGGPIGCLLRVRMRDVVPALKCVLSSYPDTDARVAAITAVNSRSRSLIDELVTSYHSSSESVWEVLEGAAHIDLSQAVGPNRMPLVFHLLTKTYLYSDKKPALLDRAGPDAVKWVDGSRCTLLHVAAGLLSPTVALPLIDLLLERGADPLAKNEAGQVAKDVAKHPDIKKHLSKAAQKRKAPAVGVDKDGLPAPKKLKKAAPPAINGNSTLYVLSSEKLGWTGNNFSEFGNLDAIQQLDGIAGHEQLVTFLRDVETVLDGVTLPEGESRAEWLPFAITNAQAGVQATFREALQAPSLPLTLEKGISKRRAIFHTHFPGLSLEETYGDDVPAVVNASSWLKTNLTQLFQLKPGGSLEAGCLPFFVGGFFDSHRIVGFVSHIVYT